MKKSSPQITRSAKLLAVAAVAFSVCGFVGTIHAAEPAFDGGKSTWHDGFVRYDFTMDDKTLAITPFTRPEKEGFAVGSPAKGQWRCIVVVPNKPAPGNPWSWQACYWDHQPQAEVELLRRGFYIAFITTRWAQNVSGQAVGLLVRLPHGEAGALQETRLRRHEQRRSE